MDRDDTFRASHFMQSGVTKSTIDRFGNERKRQSSGSKVSNKDMAAAFLKAQQRDQLAKLKEMKEK